MDYELFLSCERGTAAAVSRELALKGFKGTPLEHETAVILPGQTRQELLRAAYLLQTPLFIGWKLAEEEFTLDLEESVLRLAVMLGEIPFKELFSIKDMTFAVSCQRQGAHEYNSVDISQEAGRLLKRIAGEELGWTPLVDIKSPKQLFHVHIDDTQAFFSLDLTGRDISKRSYKVFNNPHSIKGPVAVCLLMESGWKPGENIIDPFTSGGVLPIEAALFATATSQHFYDKRLACCEHPHFADIKSLLDTFDSKRKETNPADIFTFDASLPNVTAAKKNAKIAGIERSITFSKLDIEWMDIKFAAKSAQRIIAHPIETSKNVLEQRAKKIHKDLFYQADYVLKKDGTISFICHRPEDLIAAGQEYGFVPKVQKLIHTGKLPMWILVMSK